MNLEEVQVGAKVLIHELVGNKEIIRKVEAMGLRKGKRVEVLQKVGRNMLLKLNNSKLIISKDVARDILVK
ncbi:MAG: ferrous iron transport protein A [Aquificaceae bacterium]